VPDALSRANRKSHWVDVLQNGAPTPSFLEGPSFDRDGNLWVTDIPWGRLFKITPDGQLSVAFEYDGEPNGLKFHKDGRAFITDHKHGIMVFDPKTAKIAPYLERGRFERFKGVNDLVFASNGDLYFTDQGMTGLQDPSGRLYRLRGNGQLDCLLDNVPSPNGLAFNKAETILYLCVTRNNAIWRVPLLTDGTVGRVGILICYDRHFPEPARALGLKGAELVFNPSATVKSLSRYLWELEQPAHAVANGYWIGAINRVGVEKPLNEAQFYGSSYFCDPRGKIIAQASETEDEVLVADLDLDMNRQVRNTWQFLRDRRPESYEELVKELP